MKEVKQSNVSVAKKITVRKRTSSYLSFIAVAFTLMPIVTIGIWTTQFYNFHEVAAQVLGIFNTIPVELIRMDEFLS